MYDSVGVVNTLFSYFRENSAGNSYGEGSGVKGAVLWRSS